MKGSGNRTYYVLGPLITALPDDDAAAAVTVTAPDSHQLGADGHQPESNRHQLLDTIPPALAARIPPAGSKPRREVLRALILDLCSWKALGARELAAILHGREHKPLVRDHLTPMVREGVLAYTIPEMEKHPGQRYTLPRRTPQVPPPEAGNA